MKKVTIILLLILLTSFDTLAYHGLEGKYQYPYPSLINKELFQSRRQALQERIEGDGIFVSLSEHFYSCAGLSEYSNGNSNLFYLTGVVGVKCALVIDPNGIDINGVKYNAVLFFEDQPKDDIKWHGVKMTKEFAENQLGIKTEKYSRFKETLKSILVKKKTLYVTSNKFTYKTDHSSSGNFYPDEIQNIAALYPDLKLGNGMVYLKQLREVKSDEELSLMSQAINITIAGFLETLQKAKPNMTENQLQATMEYVFLSLGASSPAYSSIVGAGLNSCFLHYSNGFSVAKDSDIVLMDCGAKYHEYCADITRTFPISGKFTKEQRQIYDIVLKAHYAAIEECRPGNKFMAPHVKAKKIIAEGLIGLGIIERENQVGRYFSHGTSHYVGLDVHDVGTFGELVQGNVITVEPGIYIPEGSLCDKKWWNIGIRIEDMIHITDSNPDIMSYKLPRTAEEIEELMK